MTGQVLEFPIHRCRNVAPPGDVGWRVVAADRAIRARMRQLARASTLSAEAKDEIRRLSCHLTALQREGIRAFAGFGR